MRKGLLAASLLSSLVVVKSAAAQSAGFGMGFVAGYVDIGGGDLTEVQDGFGLNLALRYRLSNGFSFAGGTELAWPGSDVDEVIMTSLTDFQFVSVFFEPRYNFLFPDSKVSPFIGARISYARINFNIFSPGDETPFKTDSDGVEFGGTAGVEIWLTEGVAFSITGEFSGLSFGDIKVSEPLPELPEKLGKGSKFGILAGVGLLFL